MKMADKFGSRKRGPYRSKLFEELSPPVKSQSQSETDQPSSHHAVMRRLREKIASRNDFQEGRVASQANEKMTTSGISKTQPTEANNQEDNEALWTNIELSNRMEEDHEIHIQDREELETFEPDDFMLSFDLPDDIPNISNNTDNNTDDDDDIPLYEGANVSVGAFMLVLALFASKQNFVGDGIEQLLKIFSFVLPEGNKVVTTLYSFKSYFRKLKNKLQFHYYCPKCLSNIEINYCQCQNGACGKTFDRQSLPYFIEIPIIQQLENLFLQKGFYQTRQGRFNRSTSKNQFSDIYDGQIYKQMSCNNGPLNNPDNISFILNTDGAPVFKSSGVSIWPLFLTLNELDIKHRMKPENLILSGLWFGTRKPTMCTFLKPFVSSMKQLCRGVQLFSPERGFFVCKAFLLAATADLPAKALLCNSVQYNGSYGCWHCLQKGETAHRGKGHVHVFPFKKELPKGPERTVTNVLQNAQTVLNSGKVKSVNGVKGPSWLTFCPKFDIVQGLCIDYMHGVLLGVQKLLLKLWFSKEFSAEKFSVAKCLPKVDQRLLAIQPTLNINRIPRSIQDEIKYWKASEFQNVLLYYGLPILADILDADRLLHYSLFVNAIFILLQSNATEDDISSADFMLLSFCERFAELYDISFMTLNIHQLVHLADHVRNIGPLYTNSCFPFENKNGMVLKMIKGTQNIDQQIASGVSFIQKLPELKQRHVVQGSPLAKLCSLLEYPSILKRGLQLMENTYVLGAISMKKLSDCEFDCLSCYFGQALIKNEYESFSRLEMNDLLIYSTGYSRMLKRDNSVIKYNINGVICYGKVSSFLFLGFKQDAVALVKCYEVTDRDIEARHIMCMKSTNDLAVVPIEKIIDICLIIDVKDRGVYLSNFPNKFDFL